MMDSLNVVYNIVYYFHYFIFVYTLSGALLGSVAAVLQEKKIWSKSSSSKKNSKKSKSNDAGSVSAADGAANDGDAPPTVEVTPLNSWGMIKVFIFNFIWMHLCMVGSLISVYLWILFCGNMDLQHVAHAYVESVVGHICISSCVGRVKIVGKENLPSNSVYGENNGRVFMRENKNDNSTTSSASVNDENTTMDGRKTAKPLHSFSSSAVNDADGGSVAPVYIANHSSQIDVAVVYFLKRRFKWISKDTVVLLPGVGTVMYLSQHVFINRNKKRNRTSRSSLFEKSAEAVKSGIPMFFFPQGTRIMKERLPFKDGAFIVSKNSQAPLVPITVDIPRDNPWNSPYPFTINAAKIPTITLTVHETIQPLPPTVENEKEDPKQNALATELKEQMKKQTRDIIYSALPKTDWPEHTKEKVFYDSKKEK